VHLAARFAAKEAALKALGTGLSQGISWRDVEVGRHQSGKPELQFHNVAADVLNALEAADIHISLSHTDTYAVALVVIGK